jgi:hypothetical protein
MKENDQPAQAGQQLQVKASDEALKGTYANMAQISHTQEEFVLDFMNIYPPQGILVSRVIVNPSHMKRIIAALQENLKRYESQFGGIKGTEAKPAPITTSSSDHTIGFDTQKAQ